MEESPSGAGSHKRTRPVEAAGAADAQTRPPRLGKHCAFSPSFHRALPHHKHTQRKTRKSTGHWASWSPFSQFRTHMNFRRAHFIGEGIDRIERGPYTVAHGHGHPRPRTASVVDRHVGSAGLTGASLLHAIERVAGCRRLRRVRRRGLPNLLRAGVGPPEPGAGSLLPIVAGRIFRRDRFGVPPVAWSTSSPDQYVNRTIIEPSSPVVRSTST